MTGDQTGLPDDDHRAEGPTPGQDKTAPKTDPIDGSEIDEHVQTKQPATGPKAD